MATPAAGIAQGHFPLYFPINGKSAKTGCSQIKTLRYDLNNHLTTNLINKLQDDLENIYQSAVDFVKIKTDLTIFVEKCPYTLVQLLDDNYLP